MLSCANNYKYYKNMFPPFFFQLFTSYTKLNDANLYSIMEINCTYSF